MRSLGTEQAWERLLCVDELLHELLLLEKETMEALSRACLTDRRESGSARRRGCIEEEKEK